MQDKLGDLAYAGLHVLVSVNDADVESIPVPAVRRTLPAADFQIRFRKGSACLSIVHGCQLPRDRAFPNALPRHATLSARFSCTGHLEQSTNLSH